MELVVEPANLRAALKRVQQNKGSPGVDGMSTAELSPWLHEHWPRLRLQLLDGSYRPMPVKRVSIPKKGGGTRELGIPTVVDRFVQQALLQVMQRHIDETFSDHSHGFRPGRSTHGAVRQALGYVEAGREIVVDVDLARFFDRVNHDVLMSRVARHVDDKRVLRIVRRFLEAGVMVNGVALTREEGTPQGGPLSPLLANLMLDDVDKALEASGSCFVRYADDVNVYVKSVRAGQRVMERLRKLFGRLHLQVNEEKSAVADVSERKFLGFTLRRFKGKAQAFIAPKSLARFKDRVRDETRPTQGQSLDDVITGMARWMKGWRAYFAIPECVVVRDFPELDGWVRRRLRSMILRQWRHGHVMYGQLKARRIKTHWCTLIARHARSYWANSHTSAMHKAFPNRFFDKRGLPRLST
jgi:group II intron reverse transcriptase/maturase